LKKKLKGKVLDVGCGIGDFLKFMPSAVGVDINPFVVEYCRQRGLTAYLIEKFPYPFDDKIFDSAVLDNVLEHLDDPIPTIKEIYRLLKDGGKLIVGVPGRKGFASDDDHQKFYDEFVLIDLFVNNKFHGKEIFYSPFKSRFLDEYARMYCTYAVFERV
jgi:SAM-dependent methyltransferase